MPGLGRPTRPTEFLGSIIAETREAGRLLPVLHTLAGNICDQHVDVLEYWYTGTGHRLSMAGAAAPVTHSECWHEGWFAKWFSCWHAKVAHLRQCHLASPVTSNLSGDSPRNQKNQKFHSRVFAQPFKINKGQTMR